MNIFRTLSVEEIRKFKQWARDNYTPGEPIREIWHPVIQHECAVMNEEVRLAAELKIDLYQPIAGYLPVTYLHRDDIKEAGYDPKDITDSEMMEIRNKIEEAVMYAFHQELKATLEELKVPKL